MRTAASAEVVVVLVDLDCGALDCWTLVCCLDIIVRGLIRHRANRLICCGTEKRHPLTMKDISGISGAISGAGEDF